MTLAALNPNLTSLRLDFCGRMTDTVLSSWSSSLPSLRNLELFGPFLIRTPGWIQFFESHPKLEGFMITQSPRFNQECLVALVRHHGEHLKDLRLREVGHMDDAFLEEMAGMKSLRALDISEPSTSCSEEALGVLMGEIGASLEVLNMSGHDAISETFLIDHLAPNTTRISSLSLANIPELTDAGIASFFSSWTSNPPLTYIDLSRNHDLGEAALTALLEHSGRSLEQLDINGWKEVSVDALKRIAQHAKEIKNIDVGWCREFDDFVVRDILQECARIEEVKVWGCNKLTENCPRKVSSSLSVGI